MDDKRTHAVNAVVPSMRAFPIRLEVRLEAKTSDGGWARARPVDLWVINSSTMARARITEEGAPVTPVDLHTVLHGLKARYSDSLTPQEHRRLRRYTRARRLIETMLFHPEQTVNLSKEDREKYRIAEMMNSETTERAIAILLRLQFPSILCIATSSLLNSTRRGGLFYDAFWHCRTIIADEASQIPEPVFLAIVTRFKSARHIRTGDVHQLQPHLRCPRTTLAARMAGRRTMDLLLSKEILLAPLVTTFRAHPALNQLPNMLECVWQWTPTTHVPHHRQAGHSYRATTSEPDPNSDRNGGETRRQRNNIELTTRSRERSFKDEPSPAASGRHASPPDYRTIP
uniref:AAA_11 domain-containing protein n=1 Tax=Haemonchus contortus TaxID=6289 RepID=A0A7I4Z4Q7_HAECO